LGEVFFKNISVLDTFSALSIFETAELLDLTLGGRKVSVAGEEWFSMFDES